MTRFLTLYFIFVTATGALADTPMSAAEFQAYTEGKTFFYQWQGINYGAEEYLPDRKVRWLFLGGECVTGHWYEEAGNICFIYENQSEPQCWQVKKTDAGLAAFFQNDPTSDGIYEVQQSDKPLACPGPKVGV